MMDLIKINYCKAEQRNSIVNIKVYEFQEKEKTLKKIISAL